eukprot:symbB.v1.2.007181.t1/scaffold436.1/size343649/13
MEDPEEEALKKEEEAKKWVRRVLENGFYTKAKLLACGGMGAAFRVTVKDHSERALKIALPSEDGLRYIEMELLDGDLHAEIRKNHLGKLPPEVCGKYLKHINSGLMHLHGKGLIHRDIKPANIFVAGKTCKIGDFGLTIEEETASRPDFDQLAGTPQYEMVTGELLYYDPPDEYTEVPAVNWPAFKEALQTAFYELMSTPTRRIALETVGELSELCGDWAEPKTGASIERAVRKGNKDPKLITAKNRERAKRRKRAKEKKRASKAAAKASSSNVEVVVVQDDDLQDDDEEDDDNDDGNDEKPEEVIEDEDPLELCLVSRFWVLLDRPSSVTVSLTNKSPRNICKELSRFCSRHRVDDGM